MAPEGLSIEAAFSAAGGRFVAPASEMAAAVERMEAVVFDWDGVFNSGTKGSGSASGFSEADSMGLNMLRYALWSRAGRLPVVAIVTGENNPAAVQFAEREHLHAVYHGATDKRAALRHLREQQGLEPAQVGLVFDDINDLGMAEECGLRCMVGRAASPLLGQHVVERRLCDYVTGSGAGAYAVREVTELLLGLLGVYDDVVARRAAFDASYGRYFAARQECVTARHRVEGKRISPG